MGNQEHLPFTKCFEGWDTINDLIYDRGIYLILGAQAGAFNR